MITSVEPLLALRYGGPIDDILKSQVTAPILDLTRRPSKRIRGRLVELGFGLSGQSLDGNSKKQEQCQKLAEAIETLHAGSLAIDDLQDGSQMRRGEPTLHTKYGVPLSITIGNALYFWPLQMIEAINLAPNQELALYRIYNRTLIRAHVGQALDVAIPIDTLQQERIPGVCFSSMELKSGALFSLGLLMGAIVAEASDEVLDAIDHFGHGFGIGLQMFDDLGNLVSTGDPIKRWEDLILRRPTWVWACAARHYSSDIFGRFVAAAHQLPHDRKPLETWFEQHGFHSKAKQLAHQHVNGCLSMLEQKLIDKKFDLTPISQLRKLAMEISAAYE